VHSPTGPSTLTSITVTPNVTLTINAIQQFTAVGQDAGGNIVAISPTWSVGAGGAIDPAGLFTAGSVPGTYANTVQATSGSISGTATVEVTGGALATIDVTPNPRALPINGTQQYTAVGKDAAGNVVAISPTWSVVASGGAISGAGLFTAGTVPGTFANTVKAMSGSVSGTASVTVIVGSLATIEVTPTPVTVAINGAQQFTAVGKDAGGNVVTITPIWSVVAGGGAITGAGLFTAGTVSGTFANTVQATSGSISGTATVEVTTGPLATIDVTPNPNALPINGTQQYTAVGKDAGGNVVALSPTWSVVAGGGAITGAGLFTAGTVAGTFANTVQATSGSFSGTATVQVTAGALATITVTPNPDTLAGSATQQFTAVGKDANDNVVVLSPTWAVVAGGGTITGGGLFTADTVRGTFTNTVQASSGSISGLATVVVVVPLVNLGAAATHGVLAATTVTCLNLTTINGDVGVSPGPAIADFPPCTATALHPNDAYAQSAHASLVTAFGQLVAMPCGPVAAALGGLTLQPGVYCTAAAAGLTGEVFLDALGDPNASFVIRVGAAFTTAAASRVTLLNQAQAKNVYWVIGSSTTLGANSFMKGNMIAATTITFGAEVDLVGRALARDGAVTLGTSDLVNLP
jgi:hypothetical protein